MDKHPTYMGIPTYRKYEDYIMAREYVRGWNDAMDFLFPEAKKKREREELKKKWKIIKIVKVQENK